MTTPGLTPELAARLRRKRLGLSMTGIAAKVGVSRQTVANWELGTFNTGGDIAARILQVLEDAEREAGDRLLPSEAELSARLAAVRAEYHLSLDAVARMVGVSQSTLWKLERRGACGQSVALRLAVVLDEITAAVAPEPKPEHGTRYLYCRGCRCVECKAANRDYHQRLRGDLERRVREGVSQVPHGAGGYTNWGCRCVVCKAAGSVNNRRQREARAARGLPS